MEVGNITAALILAAGNLPEEDGRGPMENVGEVSSIKRVIMVFRQAGIKKIVVITGFGAETLERHCSHLGVVFLRNNKFETGDMLSSVKVGLRYLADKCDRVFITPADVPLFSAETIKKMQGATESVVIPIYNNKTGHPLLLSGSLFERILDYDGGGGLETALSDINIERRFFDVLDRGILIEAQNNADISNVIENNSLRRIWPEMKLMLSGEKGFFGPGALQLLSLTGETGSLKQAAMQMGVSYSKAWKIIADIESQAGFPVLRSQAGGRKGGSSELTKECLDLMARYKAFMAECEAFIKTAFEKHFN